MTGRQHMSYKDLKWTLDDLKATDPVAYVVAKATLERTRKLVEAYFQRPPSPEAFGFRIELKEPVDGC